MKKKSRVSRRKFLTGVGLTAGAVALAPTLKKLSLATAGKRGLLDAWSKPVIDNSKYLIVPVKTLSRQSGTHLMPLAQRPF